MKAALLIVHRIENAVLVFMLLAMICLAGFDILARTLFGSGVIWIPPLLRVMVLWVGLLGALYATRTREHISIDILSRWLQPKAKLSVSIITEIFAAIVCGLIAWYSYVFVDFVYEMGDTSFEQIPSWILQSIIPISFTLMAVRFVIHASQDACALFNGDAA